MKKSMFVAALIVIMCGGFLFFKNSKTATMTTPFMTEGVTKIRVKSDNWDIFVGTTTEEQIMITTDESDKSIAVETVKGVLDIQQKELKSDFFGGFSFRKSNKITIQVPVTFRNEVEVISESGNVAIAQIKSENVSSLTKSGDIALKNIEGEKLIATSSSGELIIKNNQVKELSAKTTNGDINFKDFSGVGKTNITSKSGEIQLGFTSVPKNIITKLEAKEVNATILGVKDEGKNVYVSKMGTGENHLSVVNSEGSIVAN